MIVIPRRSEGAPVATARPGREVFLLESQEEGVERSPEESFTVV